ncbi:MAG: hypothetical protein LH660_18555 [Phormidesmis sp. CAN_BIN36]|nr:hypothetical protein [Phormidesmis sp. CAN_BIN36]
MYRNVKKRSSFVVLGFILAGFILLISTSIYKSFPAIAAEKTSLMHLQDLQKVAMNSSFISPLVELFGDISIGKKVFIAGNTILRTDPDTQLCVGNETNLQDNILLLALRNIPAPPSACGKRASSIGERTSIAHQAKIKNSKIGDFTFVGFHADLNNVVLENGAFVLHGAKLSNVRIGKDRLVPIGLLLLPKLKRMPYRSKLKQTLNFRKRCWQ